MSRPKKNKLDETKPLISRSQAYQPLMSYPYDKKYRRYNPRLLSEADLEILYESSPQIVSLWQTRQSFVTEDWTITGNENDPVYQFIKKNFESLSFFELAHKIQRAILMGLSLQEIVWELLPDGKYFPRAFIDIPLWRFKWSFGEVYWNDDSKFERPLERTQIFATRYSVLTKDDPYGLMRVLANTTDAELRNEFHWDGMVRRNNSGVYAFFLAQPNSSDARKKEVTDVGRDVSEGRAAAIAMGNTEKAELLEPKSKGTQGDIYKNRAKALQDKMSKLILGSTLTTDAGANASWAIGSVHENTQKSNSRNDKLLVQERINYLIRLISNINFPGVKEYPEFSFNALRESQYHLDLKLITSFGVKFSKEYIAKTYNRDPRDFEIGDVRSAKENGEG